MPWTKKGRAPKFQEPLMIVFEHNKPPKFLLLFSLSLFSYFIKIRLISSCFGGFLFIETKNLFTSIGFTVINIYSSMYYYSPNIQGCTGAFFLLVYERLLIRIVLQSSEQCKFANFGGTDNLD